MSMLNLESNGIPYHGWLVEVVSFHHRYSFRCYCSELGGFHDDGSTYNDYCSALRAGRRFIDRETALSSLLNVLEELMRDRKISIEEYWNLANFC
jgi:hypothetical protein